MNWFPPGFGDERISSEEIKRDGWRQLGILVIAVSDSRLTQTEKEQLCRIGEKLYGQAENNT